MEELTEVITAAEFHPMQCNVFMYSSSKSNIWKRHQYNIYSGVFRMDTIVSDSRNGDK